MLGWQSSQLKKKIEDFFGLTTLNFVIDLVTRGGEKRSTAHRLSKPSEQTSTFFQPKLDVANDTIHDSHMTTIIASCSRC